MRILLVHHNTNNTGDDAIVESTIDQMRTIFPNCTIILESGNPLLSKEKFSDIKIVERLFSVKNIVHTNKTFSLEFLIRNFPFLVNTLFAGIVSYIFATFRLKKFFYPILEEYRKADLILSMAGDSISEDYAWFFRFYEMWLIKKLGGKLVLYAQSIGPFTGKRVSYARKYLSMTSAILARDEKTIKLLKEYGVNTKIYRTADVAIALRSKENSVTKEVVHSYGISKKSIGIVLRTTKYTSVSGDVYKDYLEGMDLILKHIEQKGFKPLFVASIPEDAKTALHFKKKYNYEYRLLTLYKYMPSEVKTILSNFKMVISPRMHPIILTSTMCVPVIGLGKEFKMLDYLKLIGIEKLHSPMIPLNKDEVIKLLDHVLDNYPDTCNEIEKKLPEARELSNRNPQLIKELFSN